MIHIIFTSEDKENFVYGWEEFPISDIHAKRLLEGDLDLEQWLSDNLNAPDDMAKLKCLFREDEDIIDHVNVSLKFVPEGKPVKLSLKEHMTNNLWEEIYGVLISNKQYITQETLELISRNLQEFYKQEIIKEDKPYPKKPSPRLSR